jgi:glutamate racemase
MTNKPVGIFDSGMGGLTVMRALVDRLPNERFLYLGDTARLPYGAKSGETVARYALQAASVLIERDIKLLVIACNTASAYALGTLKSAFTGIPVIGVIEPGAEAAVRAEPNGPIAVMATEGTVRGGAYVRAIRARAPEAEVLQQACPLFVSLAEEGLTHGPIAHEAAAHYLIPLRAKKPRCLVLGCTHFPVLRDIIAEIMGPDVALVDSAATTAVAVEAELEPSHTSNEDEKRTSARSRSRYLVTDAPERFAQVGRLFLGTPINPDSVELIDLK